jgi:hypothetical protein
MSSLPSEKDTSKKLKSTPEYFASLERWLQEAHMWQCMNTWFPYMLLSQQAAAAVASPVPQSHATHTHLPTQHLLQHNLPAQQHQTAAATPILGIYTYSV